MKIKNSALASPDRRFNLRDHQKHLIEQCMIYTKGRKINAAYLLGIDRKTLYKWLRIYSEKN